MLERNCPKCDKKISYKNKKTLENATLKNSQCRKCGAKNNIVFIERFGTKGKNSGEKNPFYGRSHSEESKRKITENRDNSVFRTNEHREKMRQLSLSGITGHGGRSNIEIWTEKYGEEIAKEKLANCAKKHSQNNSGSGNPMYGKPSPSGSGNGWKGWYKEHYFRSLRELVFILSLENDRIVWKSAENIRIPYLCPLGKERTYSPDFLVENRLIEIKPIRLQNTPLILLKTEAGTKYAKENGFVYEIIDIEINSRLIDKYIDEIKFTGDYKERYEKWKLKNQS